MSKLSGVRRRLTYANVMSTLAVFLVLGGTATAASVITGRQIKNHSITASDIKTHSLLAKDFKKGQLPRGKTGKTGKTGPAGSTGQQGKQGGQGLQGQHGLNGASGVVSSQSAAGEIDRTEFPAVSSSGPDPGFKFAGPTVDVATTAGEKVIASFTGLIGTSSSAGSTAYPAADVCYRSTAAGSAIQEASGPHTGTGLNGGNFTIPEIAVGARVTTTNHASFTPGAGRFDVGLCIDNLDAETAGTTSEPALDNSDFAQGWAIVTH